MKNNTISVLIPTLNRPDHLLDTVYSVINSKFDCEILVCDQSDYVNVCVQDLEKKYSFLKYFKVPFKSLTKARNFLVSKTNSEICVFIDDDVELENGYFDNIYYNFQNSDVCGLTGPVFLGKKHLNLDNNLTIQDIDRKYKKGLLLSDVNFAHNPPWMIGCNHAFRRTDIIKAGGYDENFYGSAIGEDAEMSLRVKSSCGGNLFYDPTMALIHLRAPSGGCRNNKIMFFSEVSNIANSNYHFLKCKVGVFLCFSNQYILFRTYLINKKLFSIKYFIFQFPIFIIGYFFSLVMYFKWIYGNKNFL